LKVKSMANRYSRQIMIPQIGAEGQEKLARSSVLVVGAGGLGSPALTCLALAGVGRLCLVDSDTVAESNLNRQFLHNSSDIGRPKAESAKEKLSLLNNEIEIIANAEHLTSQNAEKLFTGYDIVLGAVDSFETRFVINKACISLNIPYIDGGVNDFSGCVLFSFPPRTPCLNCIYPETTANANNVGVIGTVTSVIGAIEANIALLRLLGLPNPIDNKLLLYDSLRMGIDFIEIKRNENCPICGKK